MQMSTLSFGESRRQCWSYFLLKMVYTGWNVELDDLAWEMDPSYIPRRFCVAARLSMIYPERMPECERACPGALVSAVIHHHILPHARRFEMPRYSSRL